MKITKVKKITEFNIDDIDNKTIFIFDIDETLITYVENKGFTLTDPNLPFWLHKIYNNGNPIICLTARYSPSYEQKYYEQFVFHELGLYPLIYDDTTLHNNVKIVNYTNAEFKGPHANEILRNYQIHGYNNYIMFEDRIDQLESVLSHVTNGHGVLIVNE